MNHHFHRILNLEYDKKRAIAEQEARQRKIAFLESNPELLQIEQEIVQTALSLNKAIINKSSLIDSIKKRLSSLNQKKGALLCGLNIVSSDFKPKYSCSLCDDTGYLVTDSSCLCSCYKQRLINLAYNQSLTCSSEETFEAFNSDLFSEISNQSAYGINISPRENILKIKERCIDFVSNFDNPDTKNLFFTGDTGLGKTFLSNCIAVALLQKGKTVIYQTAPKLFDLIMDYKMRYEKPDGFKQDEYLALFDVDLLIIDDLGAETQNSSRLSELFNIINTRLLSQKAKNTKTLISSNLSLETMQQINYGDRIISRIIGDFYICKFFGEDLRIKKRC